jgi:sec-independent protein translocase protein TatA
VRNIGAPEIMLILLLVVLLFGAKKLPDTARALGRSMRIFKSETKAMQADDDGPSPSTGAQASAQRRTADAPAGELSPPAPAADATTVNGRPLSESERTPKSST